MVEVKSRSAGTSRAESSRHATPAVTAGRCEGCVMASKFALVNPNWTFTGSTYFGCQEPHFPLELLFARDKISAGHEALLIDAQISNLSVEEVKRQLKGFAPDYLVIPTAPSYLFWRCPQPELR